MCIVARTDALSIDEGILRAKRFHAAGADVTLVDGLPSLDALKRVGDEVPGHKIINLIYGGKTPLLSAIEIHDCGFKIVLYSTPALYTATHTMIQAMRMLRETGRLDTISEQSIHFKEFQQLVEGGYFSRSGGAALRRALPDQGARVAATATATQAAAATSFFTPERSTSRQHALALPAE
jgi:2-methylisocitrate lyase-like PEP mutase family enzyme